MSLNERWYLGKRRCFIESSLSPLKTVLVMWVDTGGKDIVPIRLCWRKVKLEE